MFGNKCIDMRALINILLFIPVFVFANDGFIENKGQIKSPHRNINSDVLFSGIHNGIYITLRQKGFSYELKNIDTTQLQDAFSAMRKDVRIDISSERIDFTFPNVPDHIERESPVHDRLTFCNEYGTVQTTSYQKIIYRNVAPGFDVEFLLEDNEFKYNIVKKPHGNIADFFMEIGTAGRTFIRDQQLIIDTDQGIIAENIPVSYVNDVTPLKDVKFKLDNNRLQFEIPKHTTNKKLIIDPVPDLIWSTFFGGDQYDLTTATAISNKNELLQTGFTMSPANIATSGAFQTNYQGDLDAYISKFSNDGTLVWSTYYGGPQTERVYSIASTSEAIYVAGSTFSTVGIVTSNVHQSTVDGADDIFLLKLDHEGNRQWCTYHGGDGHDFITDMLVQNDTIFMAGHTTSTNNMTTPGAHEENYTADEAGHLTLFSGSGTFLWGTYFGSEDQTSIEGIALSGGHIFIGGRTNAANGISTAGTHQTTLDGFSNGFLSKFSKLGTLKWSTYYGGQATDKIESLAADTSGGIFVAGSASSSNQIATPGAHQETPLSSEQGFLAHFNGDGALLWGTFLGGSASNYVSKVVSSDSVVLIGGKTLSSDEIATAGSYQTNYVNGYDAFVQRFDFTGSRHWGTYIGGAGNEDLQDLEITPSNSVIASGSVNQNDTLFGFGNSHSDTYGGGSYDGFIVYFCQPVTPTVQLVGDSLETVPGDEYQWYYEGNPVGLNQRRHYPENDGNYSVTISSGGKCTTQSESFEYSTVGVHTSELTTPSAISVFPNPSKSQLTIQVKGKFNGELLTMQGQKVMNVAGQNTASFRIAHLPKSLYLLRLKHKGTTYKKLIIKQ